MAELLREEFPDTDMNRVVAMCLVHDFGEAVTGDIPAFFKTDAHEAAEDAAVEQLLSQLPEDVGGRLRDLFADPQ